MSTTPAERRLRHDARCRELYGMRNAELAGLLEARAAREGSPWLLGGPAAWDKDELVSAILRAEFPEVYA